MRAKFERVRPEPGRSLRILEISQPKFDAEWHFHPEWELTWILEGRGRRCVGDFTEPFASGDLVLVGPELPHFWFSEAPTGGRSRALVVQFPRDFPGEGLLNLAEMSGLGRMLNRARRGLCFSGRRAQEASRRLEQVPKVEPFDAVLEFLGVLQMLAGARSRPIAGPSYERPAGQGAQTRLGRFYAFLMEHFREPLSLAQIAEAVSMSPSACSRFFVKATGGGLWDFLVQLRLDHSASLLRAGEESIAEIAFESGFLTLSSFNRHFRKRHACSPREYRETFRQGTVCKAAILDDQAGY